jgi:hypothetical protein
VNGLKEGFWVRYDTDGKEEAREEYKRGDAVNPVFEPDAPIEVDSKE